MLTEKQIDDLLILVEIELENQRSNISENDLVLLKKNLTKEKKDVIRDKERALLSLTVRIDNFIFDCVNSEFHNCHLIHPHLSYQIMRDGYQQHGRHKLNFEHLLNL